MDSENKDTSANQSTSVPYSAPYQSPDSVPNQYYPEKQPYQPYQQMSYGYPYQYQQPVPPKKRKIWPWVLGGCSGVLLLLILGAAGCVGCSAITASIIADNQISDYSYMDDSYLYEDYADSSLAYGYTREEIEEVFSEDNVLNQVVEGEFTSGIYLVGQDIQPGAYYLDGNNALESSYYIFSKDNFDTYEIEDSVAYFGNYFIELEQGELLVFLPGDNALKGRPEAAATFNPQSPYQCGLYRVGQDIPAGTYTITASEEAAAVASMDCAAYVMKDLDWDEDSITDEAYVMLGGSQTITVKNGDWLELYAAIATPVR